MRHKISWLIALIFPVIAFFLLSYSTICQINTYLLLKKNVLANVDKLEIRLDKKNRYEILAFYSFKIGNKVFFNKNCLRKKFLNILSAQDYIKKNSEKKVIVWFNPKNPNITSIERKFPIKNCIYSVLCFSIFIYFVILKYYAYSFQRIG
jgi:hypothetical protein